MKKLYIATCICMFGFVSGLSAKASVFNLKDRFTEKKDNLVKVVSSIFVLWSDESPDSQKKRLDIYRLIEEKNLWMHHPKRLITWIVKGKMPVKHPDNRVTDEEYVGYYLIYKELSIGSPLTEQEKEDARVEAMELLNAYRTAKGIRV